MSALAATAAHADEVEKPFWALNDEGGITWRYDGRAHTDHIEMAGQQMAVVLQRYAALTGADIGSAGDLSQWSDGDQVSSWAVQSVIWALRTGMLTPRADGSLAPGENVLCGEVTGMLFRLEQRI